VPLVGVTVGLGAAALTYGAALAVTRRRPAPEAIAGGALPWAAAGGALVAVAVVLQWTAYDLTTIAVAITLLQVATPVVLIAAPLVVGAAERPNLVLVIGAVAVLAGSTVVVLAAP
jgi:drug/metabolite transporter (DMT)-like permease